MDKVSNTLLGKKSFIFFISVAFSMWLVILFASPNSKYVDESTHYRQIGKFTKGNFEVQSTLPMIPGYHLAVAMTEKPLGHISITKVRLVSFSFSIVSILIFFLILKKLEVENIYVRTLQFVFLPISFLYFPLVYTDIFSLMLVLAVFYFALIKKYNISAVFSLLAILVRQNNTVWILFVWLYDYFSLYGFSMTLKIVTSYCRRTVGYIFVLLSFLAFIYFNQGISIGDRINHQAGFYLGNIYFFLATVFLLFLPILLQTFFKINFSKYRNYLVFGLVVGAIIAVSFLLFPPDLHTYNRKLGFLRNIILQLSYHQYTWLYALSIVMGCVTLFLIRFREKTYLIFPFVAAFLIPSLLVEQRYFIIPLTFLLLLKKDTGNKLEFLFMLYFLTISSALMAMLFFTNIFF